MNDMLNSRISIIGLGTALPTHALSQTDAAKLMESTLGEKPELARFARRIFRSCGVEMRYTCEPSYTGNPEDCEYLPYTQDREVPTTEERMYTYKKKRSRLESRPRKKHLKIQIRHLRQLRIWLPSVVPDNSYLGWMCY